jgi:hypothetical protein
MRYIKLFEEKEKGYLDEPPYEEISHRRFKIILHDSISEKISFVEERFFTDLCNDSRLVKYLEPNGDVFFIQRGGGIKTTRIKKLEDHWFLVWIQSESYSSSPLFEYDYFLCDDIEGVKKVMINEKVIL